MVDAPDLGDDPRTHLEFALGKVHEDRKEHAKAMPHYLAGNKLRRAAHVYSVDDDRRPIYSSSIGLWQQHEDALAPLLRVVKV